jgi:Tol biopolymer transport system component
LAPDGERFAAEADRYQGGYDRGSLFEVPTDGSAATVTVKQPSCPGRPRFCSTFENPRWSPNGKHLAVEVSTPKVKPGLRNSLKPGIWLIKADTGAPVRRIAKRGLEVDWSPDSKYLVYRTNYQQREIEGGASGGNIFIVDAKGRTTRTLVHREKIADTQPTFAPDGRSVAFISMRFGAGDVSFDIKPSLWKIGVKNGRAAGEPKRIQRLKEPYVEEGFYHAPELTWARRP